MLISLSYPLGSVISSFVCIPLVGNFPSHAHKLTTLAYLLGLLITSLMLFIGDEKQDALIYGVLFTVACTLIVVPISRCQSVELAEKVRDANEKYLVLNFLRMSRDSIGALVLLLVGLLMEKGNYDRM